ncbi:MAG TPA: hypothetical protein VL563_16810 [Gemmatimonadales bacterium]|nr:hypothetical protein [Gemmatimonadales bacterium]
MLGSMLPLAVLLAFQAAALQDSSAYLDHGARDLVRRARERRASAEQRITDYHVRVTERISLGLRALRRDRTFYQRELAARYAWHKIGPDTVTMLGAREAIPVVYAGTRLPEDLDTDAPDLGFEIGKPGEERLAVGIGDSEFVYDPIASGSESRYRFQSGDTTVLTLQDGRTIRLLELRIIPRWDDFHLLAGSFWLEQESMALVRAVFRPARPWDLERDLDDPNDKNDAKDIPGFLKPIRGDVRYITVEFALLDGKWWLPHLVAFDAVATAGTWLSVPLHYERAYADYDVTAAPPPAAGDTVVEDTATAPDDSSAIAACRGRASCRCTKRRCRTAVVIVPDDTASLLTSADLPRSFDDQTPFMSSGEAEDLGKAVGLLPQTPWHAHAPTLRLGPGGAGLIRYNRVEALSVGARVAFDFGRLTSDVQARIGWGDVWPNAELGIGRESPDVSLRLAGYRRLAAANPESKPFGIGNSLGALVLGRDDGVYYRSWGGEVLLAPAATAPQSYQLRFYAEWQRPAVKETDVSLPHLFHSDHRFDGNISADTARQFGAALTVRGSRGISTRGITIGAEWTMDAGLGTFDYARTSLTTRLTAPLPGHLIGAVEVGAGATGGDAPVQGHWFLGGPATLRGYGGGIVSGPDFWRSRVEIANSSPGARLAVFGDAGWAGAGRSFTTGRPLYSVGVGASFLDGILRADLARALAAPKEWRVDLYVDGIL